jgi:adenosylhomocysteine nucleosidase
VAQKNPERGPVAVIAPLRAELQPFLKHLVAKKKILRRSSAYFLEAELAARPLIVGWTGDGHVAAQKGLLALFEDRPVSFLVVVGVGGGLSQQLEIAHTVTALEVRDETGRAPDPDIQWALRATLLGAHPGVVFTSPRILSTVAEKRDAYVQLGKPETATVDLETAVFARIAGDRSIPYLALRAVSDVAGEDLPVDFNRFVDANGHTRFSKVVSFAVGRPDMIAQFQVLRARVHQCAESLSQTLISLLDLERSRSR